MDIIIIITKFYRIAPRDIIFQRWKKPSPGLRRPAQLTSRGLTLQIRQHII